jgi:REP element-mobilizing transposase RayT
VRPPRFEIADGVYHVTCRAARKLLLFRSDADRAVFLEILGIAVYRAGWICFDYCLLGTHLHLLLQTPEPNLGAGMQRLNWLYSRTFNSIHGTKGHLYEDRYRAEFIQSPEHFAAAIVYLALNPVKAGLCTSAADWAWGGYRALVGLEEPRRFHDPNRALLELDENPEAARRQLRWAVEGLVPVYPSSGAPSRSPAL